MTSINTNAAAMTALQTLRGVNADLANTQNRISTGMRVNDASDNAAYWSIATSMKSDGQALGAVRDGLGMGAAKVSAARSGMDAAIEVVGEIRNKLLVAQESSVDKTKVQAEITQLQEQLQGIAESASFSGANWLSVAEGGTAPGTQSILASFSRDGSGGIVTTTIDIDTSEIVLVNGESAAGGLLSQARGTGDDSYSVFGGDSDVSIGTDTTSDQLDAMIAAVDGALSDMLSAASTLGSVSRRIDMQDDFVARMMDTIDQGVSRLVDADMAEESSRLAALQVQQQLATQALQIANSEPGRILSLFR